MTSRISDPGQLAAGWSDQELELLAAARKDHMPAALEARMREALELQLVAAASDSGVQTVNGSTPPAATARSAASGSTSAAPSAGSAVVAAGDSARATQLFSLKLPFWGTLCVVALGSLAFWGWRGATSPVVQQQLAAAAPRAVEFSPAAATSELPLVAAVSGADAQGRQQLAAAPAAPGGLQNLPLAAAAPDRLRQEAELLESARAALGRGALTEARKLLGRYAGEFEHGVLLPESDVLGIELQIRFGQQSLAKANAARFVSAYPDHPLVERVQKLVAVRKR